MSEDGSERTAQNAAACRLGMTMTDWASRSLLNFGQTQPCELGGPFPALSIPIVRVLAGKVRENAVEPHHRLSGVRGQFRTAC
ncbi:hypothetical protein [Streptomyces cyaneofuscatus]|uniref:hypothetical protein n=1 Tax=Streptomyces cyaneofuscatus TaxID=66883 RepID=UPI003333411B